MFFTISAFFFLCFAFHLLYTPEAHASDNTKEFKPLRNSMVLIKNKVPWPSWPSFRTPYFCNRYTGHFSLYVKKYDAKGTHGHALCCMAFGYKRSSWHLSICLVCLVSVVPPKPLKLRQQWHVKSLEPEICKGWANTCEHLPGCQWHKGHGNLFLGSHS